MTAWALGAESTTDLITVPAGRAYGILGVIPASF